jgi:hypothetical protein
MKLSFATPRRFNRRTGENECSIMLLEHLGARRKKHAAKLHAAVRQNGSKLRKRLKRISTEFEKLLPEASAHVAALAVKLSTDLASPARLNKRNLHPHRLQVKGLRNVLQMAGNADQQEFITRLGEVKDAIGEWHDWEELTAIAADILDHGPGMPSAARAAANQRSQISTRACPGRRSEKKISSIATSENWPHSRPSPSDTCQTRVAGHGCARSVNELPSRPKLPILAGNGQRSAWSRGTCRLATCPRVG